MISKNNLLLCFCLFISSLSFAQLKDYNYKKDLSGVSETWHSIPLNDEIFSKVSSNLNDLRIYGISEEMDTIEAPYILRINSEILQNQDIPFTIINQSKTEKGYYFTFQTDAKESINQLLLDFQTANFDWRVDLEGGQNQQEWFTILEDYRVLSIKNESTEYSFTKLNFPEAKYRYYRLLIKSNQKPNLGVALIKQTVTEGVFTNHQVTKFDVGEDKKTRATVIDFELASRTSVNSIALNLDTNFDYYRTIKIAYLKDSIKTEKGWIPNYSFIKNGTLSSMEPNDFSFDSKLSKKFRLTIYNGDNQALNISSVTTKGYKHEVVARFTEDAQYVLAYGNKSARTPAYDINRFTNTIPKTPKAINLGTEQTIKKSDPKTVAPLFENEYWLWAIMGVIILLLGFFTLKMIKKTT